MFALPLEIPAPDRPELGTGVPGRYGVGPAVHRHLESTHVRKRLEVSVRWRREEGEETVVSIRPDSDLDRAVSRESRGEPADTEVSDRLAGGVAGVVPVPDHREVLEGDALVGNHDSQKPCDDRECHRGEEERRPGVAAPAKSSEHDVAERTRDDPVHREEEDADQDPDAGGARHVDHTGDEIARAHQILRRLLVQSIILLQERDGGARGGERRATEKRVPEDPTGWQRRRLLKLHVAIRDVDAHEVDGAVAVGTADGVDHRGFDAIARRRKARPKLLNRLGWHITLECIEGAITQSESREWSPSGGKRRGIEVGETDGRFGRSEAGAVAECRESLLQGK